MDVLNEELHNSFGKLSVLRMTKNLTEEDGRFLQVLWKREIETTLLQNPEAEECLHIPGRRQEWALKMSGNSVRFRI